MNEKFMVKVTENEKGQQTISARDLYVFLGVKANFTDWIKRRIEKYGFIENVDFTKVSLISQNCEIKKGGDRKSVNYIITLGMAKELCMIENNEKGKEARRYFIECERILMNGLLEKIHGIELNKDWALKRIHDRAKQAEYIEDKIIELRKKLDSIYEEIEGVARMKRETSFKFFDDFKGKGKYDASQEKLPEIIIPEDEEDE